MARPFYDGSSFPYSENFQPLDNMYDIFPAPQGQTWVDTNDDWLYNLSPLYGESPLPIDSSYLQPTNNHNWTSEEALQFIPVTPSTSNTISPTAFETSAALPYYPLEYAAPYLQQSDRIQYQNVEGENIAVPAPKRPLVAIMPLEWKSNDKRIPVEEHNLNKKRRMRNITPVGSATETEAQVPKPKHKAGTGSLEDCMGLFDTTLTATKETRRRKVFTAQEKKAVQSVRTIGACIPCRFRKKTCSAGRPCPYCTRFTGSVSLGAQLCHRESPFIDRSVTQYYFRTSRKRIIDFQLSTQNFQGSQHTISIDGVSLVKHPLAVKIIEVSTSSLDVQDVSRILRTADQEMKLESFGPLSEIVHLLDPCSLSMTDIEQWAFEYTCRYARTKKSVATSFIFGVEYALKGLPYADLVLRMSRLVSLNFVIRTGVHILPITCGRTSFRTVQAQIDTMLFQAFQINERALHRDLQRLIFRSAGSLSRDAIIPVCLCVWQLSRLQCMLASQITNLAARDLKRCRKATPAPLSLSPSCPSLSPTPSSSSTVSTNSPSSRSWEAENLQHGLNLLLCTFESLFRSACPLLLDWNDTFSQELLANDEGLLQLARRMGGTLRGYRDRGHSRRFRLGAGYHKDMSDRIRGLMRER